MKSSLVVETLNFPEGNTLTIAQVEKMLILTYLIRNEYVRKKTAIELGISIRGLRNKINRYRQQGDIIPWNPKNEQRRKL